MERWATFDSYGTLIDWDRGIGDALVALWPAEDRGEMLRLYHRIEPRIQAGGALPYRQVLGRCARALAEECGLLLAPGAERALADSLPSWSPFPEVPGALRALRSEGWRLAVLSNTDPDLLEASLGQIGVAVDMTITVNEAGSYKPAPRHWEMFFALSEAERAHHVHVAASIFHDLEPCAALGVRAVWINRLGETSDVARAAELPDLADLPSTIRALV